MTVGQEGQLPSLSSYPLLQLESINVIGCLAVNHWPVPIYSQHTGVTVCEHQRYFHLRGYRDRQPPRHVIGVAVTVCAILMSVGLPVSAVVAVLARAMLEAEDEMPAEFFA